AIYPRDSTCPLGNETQRRAATIANRGLSATQCTALTRWRHSRMLRSSNTFVQHHYTQAMASAFFLLILFLAACLYDTGECLFLIYFPDFARQLINEWGFLLAYLDYATWLPIIVVVALWITLLGLAITGSTWQVPLLKRLARRPRVVQLSFVANSFILAIVPLTTVLALHATSLTRTSGFGA